VSAPARDRGSVALPGRVAAAASDPSVAAGLCRRSDSGAAATLGITSSEFMRSRVSWPH